MLTRTLKTEEMIVSGNRAVVPWVYRKMRNGQPWHIRGVTFSQFATERLPPNSAYVKG